MDPQNYSETNLHPQKHLKLHLEHRMGVDCLAGQNVVWCEVCIGRTFDLAISKRIIILLGMIDVNDLLEPDEAIVWKGRASEHWEPPFAAGSRLFFWVVGGLFVLFAFGAVVAAVKNEEFTVLTVLLLVLVYFRWSHVKSKASKIEAPKDYVITDQRVIFPNEYKAAAQYQSVPLTSLDEIKVVKSGDFTDIIFREERVRNKGSKHTRYVRLTYGFKGLDATQSPEAELRQALEKAGANEAYFSYHSG